MTNNVTTQEMIPLTWDYAFKNVFGRYGNEDILKRFLICSIGGDFKTRHRGFKKVILKLIWSLGKRLGFEKISKKISRIANNSQKNKKKYVGCLVWTCHQDKEVFSSEIFANTEFVRLRNREFPAFSKYDEYLSSLYGKWRDELPKEKQHSNHDIKVWWKNES